jgi:predicted metal-binding protein
MVGPTAVPKQEVLIVGCKNMMIGTCVACSRCIDAVNNQSGEFAPGNVPGLNNPELIGLLDCGGCPGNGMNARLNDFKLWNQPPMGNLPDYILTGNCISATDSSGNYICPYAKNILAVINEKGQTSVPVIPVHEKTHGKGKHPIKPAAHP